MSEKSGEELSKEFSNAIRKVVPEEKINLIDSDISNLFTQSNNIVWLIIQFLDQSNLLEMFIDELSSEDKENIKIFLDLYEKEKGKK